MNAAMQLGRTLFLVILAGLGTACAARPAPTPTREPAAAPPVGYASVTAAEVTEPTKEAPVVGKSQWSAPERERETLDEPKAAPRRHAPRTTGGFSGYK
jgi:hypothetical protein